MTTWGGCGRGCSSAQISRLLSWAPGRSLSAGSKGLFFLRWWNSGITDWIPQKQKAQHAPEGYPPSLLPEHIVRCEHLLSTTWLLSFSLRHSFHIAFREVFLESEFIRSSTWFSLPIRCKKRFLQSQVESHFFQIILQRGVSYYSRITKRRWLC